MPVLRAKKVSVDDTLKLTPKTEWTKMHAMCAPTRPTEPPALTKTQHYKPGYGPSSPV